MKRYTLLVNGADLDTGIYEFLPYADKAISDFRSTYKMILSLKKGLSPEQAEDYIYARYCVGDQNTNKKAIEAAFNASRIFRQFPVSKRLKILYDIHKYLVMNRDNFINLLVIEGHPIKMARWEYDSMELGYRKETLDLYKDELWKEVGRDKNETIYWARKPDGVVGLSTPKNASASNSLTAGYALLGGNTLIVKPPLKNPVATIYLWKDIVNRALTENGAPPGTVNIVLGNSKKITEEWLSSPCVNDVIYFGDSETGLEVGRQCFAAGKKAVLELSGNDTLFVWKDCDLEGAVRSSMEAFIGSTQVCMVPKTIVIHNDIYDAFKFSFLQKVRALVYGLPSDPETILSPVAKIDEFFLFLEDAIQKRGNLLCGGNRVNFKGKEDINGHYIQPTVVEINNTADALKMRCVMEENFFPLLPLIRVGSSASGPGKDELIFKEMMDFAGKNEYGLRTSVWINSYLYTRKFIKHLNNSGILRINSSHVALSRYLSSHGGTGKTGGPHGEMNYMWQKTTHLQGISLTRKTRQP